MIMEVKLRKKKKTIILAKIRRYLRELARHRYSDIYEGAIDKDVEKISIKIYNLK